MTSEKITNYYQRNHPNNSYKLLSEILSNQFLQTFITEVIPKNAFKLLPEKSFQTILTNFYHIILIRFLDNDILITIKSDMDNFVAIVDKAGYLDKMENLLNDTQKFEKINLQNDGILNFAVNQEKSVDNIFKKLVATNSISEETRKSLKPVGTRPGIMYGLCKVHKDIIDNFAPFRPIFSTINTPTYKVAKFLAPILKSFN